MKRSSKLNYDVCFFDILQYILLLNLYRFNCKPIDFRIHFCFSIRLLAISIWKIRHFLQLIFEIFTVCVHFLFIFVVSVSKVSLSKRNLFHFPANSRRWSHSSRLSLLANFPQKYFSYFIIQVPFLLDKNLKLLLFDIFLFPSKLNPDFLFCLIYYN